MESGAQRTIQDCRCLQEWRNRLTDVMLVRDEQLGISVHLAVRPPGVMNQRSTIPIPWYSRVAAALLGTFILGVGLWFAWRMLSQGWYVMVALGLLLAFGGSLAFLHAAYTGTSPRWPDEDASHAPGPAA